nr:uncharacterized protein LOC112543537 [Pelodiscus sinensis]|eukprot:XP_025033719.1 uncharacterized protein LOC112543537 [Pelodiscus sinensis]
MEAAKETDQAQELKDPIKHDHFQAVLEEKIPSEFPEEIEEHWSQLKAAIINTCDETIGYHTRQHQDWFDENYVEIKQLINEKRMAFCAWQNDINCKTKREAHAKAKVEVQHKTRELKNKWWTESARTPHFVATHNTRGFLSAIKAVDGPVCHGMNPLCSKDGTTLLQDNEVINFCWKKHFEDLLNRNSMVADEVLEQIPQRLLLHQKKFYQSHRVASDHVTELRI